MVCLRKESVFASFRNPVREAPGSIRSLTIDDLGYVQQSEEIEVLFTSLAEQRERGSVLILSNLPFLKCES